jgi:hypothetical protein
VGGSRPACMQMSRVNRALASSIVSSRLFGRDQEGSKSWQKKQGALRLVPETLHERFRIEAALPHSLMSSLW